MTSGVREGKEKDNEQVQPEKEGNPLNYRRRNRVHLTDVLNRIQNGDVRKFSPDRL